MTTPPTTSQAAPTSLFRLAILLKGADGALQLLAALLLAVVPPAAIAGVANAVVTRDLVGDHDGTLAHHVSRAAQSFATGDTRWFAIAYLLLHGLVKLALVVALWRRVMWAYPVACLVLGVFVVYEVLRAVRTGSIGLPVFAAIDVLVIFLVAREYVRERARRRGAPVERGRPG